MRKNHHGKNDRLVKRVFALCLALAVICTCLVPVFATEDLIDPQLEQEATRSVEGGEASYPDDEFAGFGEEEAPRPVEGGEEEASRPVDDEGGDSEWDTSTSTDTSTDTDTSTSTDTSSSTVTQWPGEDDEIKKPQDMVVYRFWLKELNADVLEEITAQAQINNMTESEYLAQNGEKLWNLYFIQAVPRAETIADYSSYIKAPSSNQDPEGMLRLFDYWYTLDEFGNRVRLNLTDPTSNILDDKTTTVNVYAAWQDGTVGSDEEEDVVHEDLVDKNPVPVNLETTAAATYKDEDGNTRNVNLEVKNLPAAATSLSVIHMDYDDVGDFYEKHSNDFEGMAPLLGLKISPKNANGEKVQLAEGEKATVTVSGLDKLPAMEGATANTLKVLHETSDGNVEILDVLTYTDGTLTFKTSSFSPFVVVRTDGYDVETLDLNLSISMTTADTPISLQGGRYYTSDHKWSITNGDSSIITLTQNVWAPYSATVEPLKEGNVTVTHTYKNYWRKPVTDTYNITITRATQKAAIYFLSTPRGIPESNEVQYWSPKSNTSQLLGEISVNESANYWAGNDKRNITNNVGSFILEWPDGTTSGDSWTLTSENMSPIVDKKTAFNYVLDSIWDSYKAEIAKDLDVGADTLSKGDISQITLKAFKISRNNSNTENQYFHIDCTLDIKSSRVFTAKFMVKYPGHTDYTLVDAKNYVTGNSVENTSVVDKSGATPELKSKYTDSSSGITYQLSGWYTEKDGGPYDKENKKDLKEQWSYRPTENELQDGTVHFYAHYEPISADLTISKTVTGMLGDQHKAFTFQIVDSNGNAVALTESNIEKTVGNLTEEDKAKVGLVNNGTEGKFTLVSGASITLKNLPSGEYRVIEDTVVGYDTSWKLGESGELHEKSVEATVTVQGATQTIAFTNHATLEPDTGVLLDTLPYIVILAVVAGGVALLMLRKRRKEDD